MGMNAATTLNTEATLVIGDKSVAPGEYSLTAKRVTEDSWHLIFGSDSGNVEVPLQAGKAGSSVETFTIQLDSRGSDEGSFSMAWGTLMVGTGFKVK
jgi:hypothetical protein